MFALSCTFKFSYDFYTDNTIKCTSLLVLQQLKIANIISLHQLLVKYIDLHLNLIKTPKIQAEFVYISRRYKLAVPRTFFLETISDFKA